VAANSRLRERLREAADRQGFQAAYPPLSLCTDNAAMVAAAGWWRLQSDGPSPLDTGASPNLKLPTLP
jgi:N6-L-threonylcarbamoyladenine synthase